MKFIKVALIYDRVNKFGGAERILIALHKIFPNAPLFTSVFHPGKAKWAKNFKIKTSFLQNIPFAKSHHQFFAPLMPIAFKSFDFKGYDLIISVTSEFAKGIVVKGKTVHICICLTPTRYLWSGYNEYFSNKLFRQITKPLIGILREIDINSSKNPHGYIAISKEVKRRIKKYYKREAEVIYPPVTLLASEKKILDNGYKILERKNHKYPKGYFLVVSRLSKFTVYKRVEIAIKAATKLNIDLIVIGEGNQKYFKKFAGPKVKFIKNVTDENLREYYKNAKALIFPGREDFGLVMVEAQSSGIPVIAYKAGGALEIVKPGITGEFFRTQNVSSLVNLLKGFNEKRYNSKTIRDSAKRFTFYYFAKKIREYILSL